MHTTFKLSIQLYCLHTQTRYQVTRVDHYVVITSANVHCLTSLSHRGRLEFNPRQVHVGFMVNEVMMLGQVCLLHVLRFSRVSIIPP